MFKYRGPSSPRKLRVVREECTAAAPCVDAKYHEGGHETGKYRNRAGDQMICYECSNCHAAWEIAD